MGGRSSGSSGGGGNNKSPQQPRKQLKDKPIYQDAIIRGNKSARSYVATENKISEITKKQIADPTRMQGGADSDAVWRTVSSKPGNFVTDSKGNPLRTSSGKAVMTSKGRKEYNQAMSRIPLTKAQVDSQRKFMSVASLPLMFVPGGGLLRTAAVGNFDKTFQRGGNQMATYGKGNLLSQDESNEIATMMQEAELGRQVDTVDLSKRPKKAKRNMNLLDRTFATLFGGGNLLGTGGNL
jgi:hypothetical protein